MAEASVSDSSWKQELEFIYEQEYLQTMFEREAFRHPVCGQSPQLSFRGNLVTELGRISEELSLSTTTVHLALYLLDRFMDQHDIAPPQLTLAVSGSISIAAKYEERDPGIPRISEINALNKTPHILREFVSMEIVLLSFFDWYVGIPTAAHFMFYYLAPSSWKKCPWFENPSLSLKASRTYFEARAQRYLDSTVHGIALNFLNLQKCALSRTIECLEYIPICQDYRLVNILPSHLAAACLAATRIELHLEPVWPEVCQNHTRYLFSDLAHVIDIIMKWTDIGLFSPPSPKRGSYSDCKQARLSSPDSAYGSSVEQSSKRRWHKRQKKLRKKKIYSLD